MKSKKLRAVSNSGPLIHLAKINALWLLEKLFDEILIPIEVKEETVDAGLKLGFDDARIIQKAIKDGKIKLVKYEIKDLLRVKRHGIDPAEFVAIMLAVKENCIFLCDDEQARRLAEEYGIKVKGSIGIILMAVKRGLVTKKKAVEYISKLKEVMYFSEKLFQKVIKELEAI